MKSKFYTQLLFLIWIFMTSTQASAHEMHDTTYYASSSLYVMWHDLMHAIGGFFAQMSSGYVLGLTILLSILGYIAVKVKRAEQMVSP